MECIGVTNEFGIIVRLASLGERGVTLAQLLTALEASTPFDTNDKIASFGPHFGQEASDSFVRRLSDLGLQYFEDFFEFSGDFPTWCVFKACAAR
ncbi:hypothetical protein JQ597_34660 [Bradyrhizobium sp. AUGA SZCCT0177]|uniref:hypothetical protein n=1 Tax=Bradyrhizobium sp. AUGA SZCCT0177 TaxID=2807665 RepID=UPI001BA698FC|nr:hypothetical protein [Bradyrhizobium sp. AUGA SZCCT0177]MBR1287209.1 hypothetical protein [Bradyrhizobium sp. AUGA SZCCT0177]